MKTGTSLSLEYKNLNDMAQNQLLHFRFGPIWDGNVNSKSARDALWNAGYIERNGGFQFLTAKGIELLISLGKLNESTWREHPGFKGAKNFNGEEL